MVNKLKDKNFQTKMESEAAQRKINCVMYIDNKIGNNIMCRWKCKPLEGLQKNIESGLRLLYNSLQYRKWRAPTIRCWNEENGRQSIL